MKVDMNLLKKLRELTHAPIKDCKEALIEAEGDVEKAQQIMKEKGVLKAGKKADRETFEGVVKGVTRDARTAIVKVLCETDFVAKNESFHALVDALLERVLQQRVQVANIDALDKEFADVLHTIVAESISTVGENVKLADVILTQKQAYVYNHAGNKVCVLVYYTGDETTAKEVALQVAAMDPQYLTVNDVPATMRDELVAQAREELKDSGKPENVVEQIVQGKVLKTLAESVLMEQEYIRDGGKKIKDIIPSGFQIDGFVRLSI